MSRDIPPYGLRMPPDLKATLERQAELSGRSLNAEINARLLASLEEGKPHAVTPALKEPPSDYLLNKPESEMLTLFRRWTADRQLAFLVLFR